MIKAGKCLQSAMVGFIKAIGKAEAEHFNISSLGRYSDIYSGLWMVDVIYKSNVVSNVYTFGNS